MSKLTVTYLVETDKGSPTHVHAVLRDLYSETFEQDVDAIEDFRARQLEQAAKREDRFYQHYFQDELVSFVHMRSSLHDLVGKPAETLPFTMHLNIYQFLKHIGETV